MFKFSPKSLDRLSSAHAELQLLMLEAIKVSRVDFGINEAHRTLVRQQELFNKGKSHIDPSTGRKGKHNYYPSQAVDIFGWAEGKSRYDDVHIGYLVGLILTIADGLHESGNMVHKVRNGFDWDMDGLFVLDHSLKDGVHFELI